MWREAAHLTNLSAASYEARSPNPAPRTFARTAGLKATDADAVIDKILGQVGQAVDQISLPTLAEYGPKGKQVAEQMLELVRSRLAPFG